MWIYLIISVSVVTAAYFVNNRYETRQSIYIRQQMWNRAFLVFIFVILFLPAALRINVGNDYAEYIEIFNKVSLGEKVSTEIGFNLVIRIFQTFFGEGTYIPIFAFFSAVTIIFMLKFVYEQCEWFWFGMLLFLCSGYYFSALNTVRYYFAFAIALYAARYVIKKKYIQFVLWILLAACFHKTVLVVIPLYLFTARKWKKLEMILIAILSASFLLLPQLYRKIIFIIYPYYENSTFDNGSISYMNILKCAAVLIFALIYYKASIHGNRQNTFYFNLNIAALLLYSLGSFIPEVSRLGYYMVGFQSILLPNILSNISNKKHKIIFSVLIAAAFLGYFAIFLHRAGGVDLRIIPYRTWILHELVL